MRVFNICCACLVLTVHLCDTEEHHRPWARGKDGESFLLRCPADRAGALGKATPPRGGTARGECPNKCYNGAQRDGGKSELFPPLG